MRDAPVGPVCQRLRRGAGCDTGVITIDGDLTVGGTLTIEGDPEIRVTGNCSISGHLSADGNGGGLGTYAVITLASGARPPRWTQTPRATPC